MQNKQCDLSIVDRIVVVVPRFSQWTGTRAMHEGDFSVGTNGRLPPKEVTKSLGLKAIIDTQQLRIFDRLKHKAEAILDGCGVRYLSGWAIPQDRADEVFKELDDLVGQYDEAKRDFLARYDSLVSDWAAKNPQFSREILEGKLDGASVAERIRAGYDTFRLRPVSKERAHELVQTVGGLARADFKRLQTGQGVFQGVFSWKNAGQQKDGQRSHSHSRASAGTGFFKRHDSASHTVDRRGALADPKRGVLQRRAVLAPGGAGQDLKR